MKAEWKKNPDPDAEYGSQVAELNGHKLEVYSDRDGERWSYTVDGGESFDAEDEAEAKWLAERDAK